MRRLNISLLTLLFALLFVGCATPDRPASQAYTVDETGAVEAGTRSAMDGTTAPGRQELVALYAPFGPFAIKAGLVWDGTTFRWGPPAPARAPVARPTAVCEEVMVEETYTEMVPVQRTRVVPQRRVTIPAPQAGPQCKCPAPPPSPPGTSSCPDPAVCEAPALEVARRDR